MTGGSAGLYYCGDKSFWLEDGFSGCAILSPSVPHGPVPLGDSSDCLSCASHPPGTAEPLKGAQGSVLEMLTVWMGNDDNDQTTYIYGTLARCVPGTPPSA